jgi:hypothetical protein
MERGVPSRMYQESLGSDDGYIPYSAYWTTRLSTGSPTVVQDLHSLLQYIHGRRRNSDSYEDRPLNIPAAFLGGFKRPISENANSPSVMPPGGAASLGFPFSAYQQRVDKETDVLRINEPLTRCAEKRYIPNGGLPAPATSTNKIPDADISQSSLLSPLATFVKTQAGCRNNDDEAAWNRSARLFFNPTRYDRTKNVPAGIFTADSGAALYCPPWTRD